MSSLAIDHYDFSLPKELIAQHPLPNRSDARLLVVRRQQNDWVHAHVRDLPDYLESEDALVFNDTRVLPARLVGHRASTGGRWQGLFLDSDASGCWKILGKARGRLVAGEEIVLLDRDARPAQKLTLLTRTEEGGWIVKPDSDASVEEILARVGRVPLPHYIRGGEMVDADLEDYQTVFAQQAGAVAAPTAGLHFTRALLERLRQKEIDIASLTLHVGVGTFRPVTAEHLDDHQMHEEWGTIEEWAVAKLLAARAAGGRIVAVGTTSVRVLETAVAAAEGELHAWTGATNLFIHPPYQFRAVDALLTNFHLPRSTLLVLVRTFGGDDLISRAYEEAVKEEYRFFSYGDAMLIV